MARAPVNKLAKIRTQDYHVAGQPRAFRAIGACLDAWRTNAPADFAVITRGLGRLPSSSHMRPFAGDTRAAPQKSVQYPQYPQRRQCPVRRHGAQCCPPSERWAASSSCGAPPVMYSACCSCAAPAAGDAAAAGAAAAGPVDPGRDGAGIRRQG